MKTEQEKVVSVNAFANIIQLATRVTQKLVGDGVDASATNAHANTESLNSLSAARLRKAMSERGMVK